MKTKLSLKQILQQLQQTLANDPRIIADVKAIQKDLNRNYQADWLNSHRYIEFQDYLNHLIRIDDAIIHLTNLKFKAEKIREFDHDASYHLLTSRIQNAELYAVNTYVDDDIYDVDDPDTDIHPIRNRDVVMVLNTIRKQE